MPRMSARDTARPPRLEKCVRDIARLRDRIHRLRSVLYRSIDQERFRYFELRENLERVLEHCGMQFIEGSQDDAEIYETVSTSDSS